MSVPELQSGEELPCKVSHLRTYHGHVIVSKRVESVRLVVKPRGVAENDIWVVDCFNNGVDLFVAAVEGEE